MPLPVPSVSVAQAYEALRGQGINTKSYFANLRAMIAQDPAPGEDGGIDSQYFLAGIRSAANTLEMAQEIATNKSLAGAFVLYVQQQIGDPNLDVGAALQESMKALGAAIAAMVADYPKDGGGYLLDRKFSAGGLVVPVTLPPASLAASDAAMAVWLTTIV
jgi:hypothetical protein